MRTAIGFEELSRDPEIGQCIIAYEMVMCRVDGEEPGLPEDQAYLGPREINSVLSEALQAVGNRIEIVAVVPIVTYVGHIDSDAYSPEAFEERLRALPPLVSSVEALRGVLQSRRDCDCVVFPFPVSGYALGAYARGIPDAPPVALLGGGPGAELPAALPVPGKVRLVVTHSDGRGQAIEEGRVTNRHGIIPPSRYRRVFEECFELRHWPAGRN